MPPVLFLIFNRPQTTALVMEAIRASRPARLYVAADGPRADRPGESERCEAARRIATAVDWPCQVETLFRDRNLGCRRAVSGAITWFFEREPEGIVLEDDCLPSQSFFRYCAELLERYRHDERVMCISGCNFQPPGFVRPHSYFYSGYPQIWGWATWRRAWELYDAEMSNWPSFRDLGGVRAWSDGDREFERLQCDLFDRSASGEIDTWDYMWLFSCWLHHGLSCQPVRNLVSNIGFGPDAHHTFDPNNPLAGLPTEELTFPLSHPSFTMRDVAADAITREFAVHSKQHGMKWVARLRFRLGLRTRLRQFMHGFGAWCRAPSRRVRETPQRVPAGTIGGVKD